jgi:hypothetical protein
VIGTERLMSEPPCARRRATSPDGGWGYSTRCHMLGPERPEALLPDRALYLQTFSHFLISHFLIVAVLSIKFLSLPPPPPPYLLFPPPPPQPPSLRCDPGC